MSINPRQHASPEEFQKLVDQYYARKKAYDATWITAPTPSASSASSESTEPPDESLKEDVYIIEITPKFEKEEDKSTENMPHHDSEETTGGSITDLVAKESKDSTASDHSLHDEDTGASSGGKTGPRASIADHQAKVGPALSDNMPEKSSKDELAARTTELNK